MSVLAQLQAAGMKQIKRAGKQYRFVCPFHEEKTGSAYYHTTKHGFKCFGCGAAMWGKKFWERVLGGVPAFVPDTDVSEYVDTTCPDFDFVFSGRSETLDTAADYFDQCEPISMHQEAADYLLGRLGPGYFMPVDCRYHAHTRSLWFWNGINYVRKDLDGGYRTYGDAHLFTHLEAATSLVLVEGLFDYLCPTQCGINTAACLGTAMTDRKISDLIRLGVKTVYLAFDNDPPGRAASYVEDNGFFIFGEAAKAIDAAGIEIRFVRIPEHYKDFGKMPYAEIVELFRGGFKTMTQVRLEQLERKMELFNARLF